MHVRPAGTVKQQRVIMADVSTFVLSYNIDMFFSFLCNGVGTLGDQHVQIYPYLRVNFLNSDFTVSTAKCPEYVLHVPTSTADN